MCESWNICLACCLGDKVLEIKVMLEQSMAFMELKKAVINHETNWARFGDCRNQLVAKYIGNVDTCNALQIYWHKVSILTFVNIKSYLDLTFSMFEPAEYKLWAGGRRGQNRTFDVVYFGKKSTKWTFVDQADIFKIMKCFEQFSKMSSYIALNSNFHKYLSKYWNKLFFRKLGVCYPFFRY